MSDSAVLLLASAEGLFLAGFIVSRWRRSPDHQAYTPQATPRATQRPIGPCLCDHRGHQHSEVLVGNPCLECDCPAFMPGKRRGARYVDDGSIFKPRAYFGIPEPAATPTVEGAQ